MKKYIIILIAIITSNVSFGQDIFISEISYIGTTLQRVELSSKENSSTNISGWVLEFYGQGSPASKGVYATYPIVSASIPANGVISFDVTSTLDIVDGANTGIAIANGTTLIGTFITWNGVFNPNAGVAKFSTPFNTGITQSDTANSMQLTDVGWVLAASTFGSKNSSLTLPVPKNEIKGFKLFPTVVKNGKFSITTNNSQEKNVKIYSILGSLVYENQVQPYENVNIRNLSTGLYFVQVEEDKKVSVKKIVVN